MTHFVLRLSYAPLPTLTFLDEIPDSSEDLADDCAHTDLIGGSAAKLAGCTAVMHTPLYGGGLFQTGDEVTDLPATRLVMDACLMPNVFSPAKAQAGVAPAKQTHGAAVSSGVAVQAVLATGLGISVISASVLERLKPLLGTLPTQVPTTLNLPYGKEQVTIVTLERAALVSNETLSLGPCSELALRRRLLVAGTAGLSTADSDLLKDKKFNGASIALRDKPVSFAVVKETSPLIQGLRKELRSSAANIDMIIGGSLLKHFELEVDYPKSRTILRCASGTATAGCLVTPFCAHEDNTTRDEITCPTPAGG